MGDMSRTGKIKGDDINSMFTAILGFECSGHHGSFEYDLNAFKNVCRACVVDHPGWNVRQNLLDYLHRHMDDLPLELEEQPAPLEDAIGADDMRKLFKLLDADDSGSLEIMEAYRLFKAVKLPVSLLINKLSSSQKDQLNFDEFRDVINQVEDEHPEKNVDGKILEFLENNLHTGKPPMPEVNMDEPDDPPKPARKVKRKRALIVGINYIGTENELGGCINDATAERDVHIDHFGFKEKEVMLLSDDQPEMSQHPTKENMVAALDWLMKDAMDGDVLFFHYSGHGAQYPDETGEEEDGLNECLCPCDCMENPWPDAVILDDYLNDIFFDNLPDGVRLTCVYDCCHSGTMTDLSVTTSRDDVAGFGVSGDEGSARKIKERKMDPPPHLLEKIKNQNPHNRPKKKDLATRSLHKPSNEPKTLWTISGCQDNQTSADATINGRKCGALTWSLHAALSQCNYNVTYYELLHASRKKLRGQYTQIPNMQTTHADYFEQHYIGCGLESEEHDRN